MAIPQVHHAFAMLPTPSDPRWASLLTGTINHKFSNAAASMLIFQLKARVKRNPADMSACVGEMHTFFAKYQNMLRDDIRAIFQ